MPTFALTEKLVVGDTTISKTTEQTATARVSIEESIPDAAANEPIAFTLDVSQLKSIYIVSDQDVLLETNDGTTPDDSISLLAGVPYVWTDDSYHACLLTADVTGLFITNASGNAAAITIEALYDPTV